MTRMRTTVLVVCVAVALAMVLVPTAGAAAPVPASGTWEWENTGYTITDLPGGHQLFAGTEDGFWDGTFVGTSTDVFEMKFWPPFDYDTPDYGPARGWLMASFQGAVNGVEGSMTMNFTIREAANDPVMTGRWVIVGGLGGLKGISGNGTWVSSGFDSSATYEGKIHLK